MESETETICGDCRHYLPADGVLYVCTRFVDARTDGVTECFGFEPDGAVSRAERAESGKTCADCSLAVGGRCAITLDRVGTETPACSCHRPLIERLPEPGPTVADLIRQECDALCEMLLEKNRRYGNSALDPVRCLSKADPIEQLKVRADDKISRLMRGHGIEDEDVEQDLMGYLVLLRVARRMNREGV